MNECFTVPIFKICVSGKEKRGERRGVEKEGGEAERKVSYSVSGDLQIS